MAATKLRPQALTWNRRYQVKSYLRSSLWIIPLVALLLAFNRGLRNLFAEEWKLAGGVHQCGLPSSGTADESTGWIYPLNQGQRQSDQYRSRAILKRFHSAIKDCYRRLFCAPPVTPSRSNATELSGSK